MSQIFKIGSDNLFEKSCVIISKIRWNKKFNYNHYAQISFGKSYQNIYAGPRPNGTAPVGLRSFLLGKIF